MSSVEFSRESFFRPEPSTPQPMSYEDDGSVHGHAAIWGSCHRGFMGGAFESCVTPPRSATNYEQFHQGYIQTQEGERVAIGKITFDTDHAPLTADVVAASRHYDNTGSVGAYVRASNGKHGIWLSGVLREDLASSALTALRANPVSGDWRLMKGNLEMVAALAVPVNGFSTPQLALSASGGVSTLILPGECDCEEEEALIAAVRSKSYYRRKNSLMKAMRAAGIFPYDDGFTAAVFTEKQRRRLAKSGAALPDGSFPIRNCSDLANARQAIGRAAPGKRARVRAHIAKRAKALGCSTS